MNSFISDASTDHKGPNLGHDVALGQLRTELMRFAILQLRNHDLAEDAVQEALAAAVTARDRFEQRASVKSTNFLCKFNYLSRYFLRK